MDIESDIKQAIKYTSKKDYDRARLIYEGILNNDPENVIVLSLLGRLLLTLKKRRLAKKYLIKSYQIKPLTASAECLAILFYDEQRYFEAEQLFEQVFEKTKDFTVLSKYISLLIKNDDFHKAFAVAEKLYKLYPLQQESILNYVYTSTIIGKPDVAYPLAEQMVRNYPKNGNGWIKLGLIYELYFHDDKKAELYYKKGLKCGAKESAYYNLAINASRQGDYKKSLNYIKKLNAKDESNDFIKAINYYKLRQFMKGYKYSIPYLMNGQKSPAIRLKRHWDGKTHKDETLLILCDQGFGDVFMYARYLPFVQNKFKQIKVVARQDYLELFKRSFKHCKKIKFYLYNKETFPHYDKSTILSSLPYFLKMDIKDIPNPEGYLIPSADKIKQFAEKMTSKKLKVGVCWEAGNASFRGMIHRTININMLDDLLKTDNVQCYSFQVKMSMDNYRDYTDLILLGGDFKDFDDTAGALKNLDVLVTVDTSVAHLAGAMGVKTFLLIPYCSDWRWFDNNKTTEWYNSVTLFQQTSTKTWDDVIQNLCQEIQNIINNN